MRRYLLLKNIILALILVLCGTLVSAQDLLKGRDLSQVRVDQLTDADIAKLKAQLASSGMTLDQAEQMALSKGMSSSEWSRLKQKLTTASAPVAVGRLNQRGEEAKSAERINNSSDSLTTDSYRGNTKPLINPLIFGSELYTAISPSFEPNLKLATPLNYILGPDDQILISVYGIQEYTGDLLISPEGNVSIPNVGQVKISGLTIEAATERIRTIMSNTVYPHLKTGGSKLSVTLSRIRSIRVTVIGSNHPGNYTLSSLSTVFNALYMAGGPSEFGSFREIELYRDNKLLRKIDLYRFLLHGDQTDNIGLKDNDVIRIPAYKSRVELQGQVKRPGIFEILPNETFAQILEYASGFTDTAYRQNVKVFQRDETQRKVHDLFSTQYRNYEPVSGDIFVVSKILNRFQNRVSISGAVFRPDAYELSPGLRVSELIRRADGLKEDAFVSRGQIIRLREDLTRSIIPFDVKAAMAGDLENNIELVREDEVYISSILNLTDSFKVTIQGEIRLPGKYDYVSNLTLKDLILQAGGFTDAAYKNIEIARLIKRDSLTAIDNRVSEVINTQINNDLIYSSLSNITLQPFDVITVRRKAGYYLPESVIVNGEVQYPGPYALSKSNERISDLLRRAGGYSPDAFPEGAYLKRYKTENEKQRSEDVIKSLQKKIKDTTDNVLKEVQRDYDKIPVDLKQILKNPGSIEDIVLKARDELFIPKFDGQVKISGAVLLTTQVPFQQGYNLNEYINSAGGYNASAWRKRTYIVYPNGKAATTKHFMFFKFHPRVLPGSEVIVPEKPVKKNTSLAEIIGISSAIASLAGVVIALLRL